MDRAQKKKYLVLIYSCISFIAIILILVSFRITDNSWQSLIQNLATELIGATLIFIIVNYLFFIDDWDLSENIKKILSRLDKKNQQSADQFFIVRPELSSYLREAQSIDLCGISRYGTLSKQFDVLKERLGENCRIRILLVDDKNHAAIQTTGSKSAINDESFFLQQIKQSKTRITFLSESIENSKPHERETKGSLEVRLLQYSPSFGITAFDSNNKNGRMYVEIFPHIAPSESPHFELSAEDDAKWHKYFANQFEKMWSRAEPWQPKSEKTAVESRKVIPPHCLEKSYRFAR